MRSRFTYPLDAADVRRSTFGQSRHSLPSHFPATCQPTSQQWNWARIGDNGNETATGTSLERRRSVGDAAIEPVRQDSSADTGSEATRQDDNTLQHAADAQLALHKCSQTQCIADVLAQAAVKIKKGDQ